MPFGIELLFDSKSDKAIRNIWRRLEQNKIPTPLGRDNPHVTLAAFDNANMGTVEKKCRKISKAFSSLPACFESVGSFTKERVLFLAPVVTPELLKLHQEVHKAIEPLAEGQSSYYLPGTHWAPHCTLSMSKSKRNYLNGVGVLSSVSIGWKGWFTRLEGHEYEILKDGCSKRIRTVFSAKLTKK